MVRNTGNKAQLRLAGAGALPELGNNLRWGNKVRRLRNKTRGRIEAKLGTNSSEFRKLMTEVKNHQQKLRAEIRAKNHKKEQFLTKKYVKKHNCMDDLNNKDKSVYGGATVFQENCSLKADPTMEPVIVNKIGENIELSRDEVEVLSLGSKFNIINNLNEERFEVDFEKIIMKYRWYIMGQEINENKKTRKKSLSDVAAEAVLDDENLQEIKEHEELEEAKLRQIFDHENLTLNFSKRRATDLKANASMNIMQRQFGPKSQRRTPRESLGEYSSGHQKNSLGYQEIFLGVFPSGEYLLVTKKYFLVKILSELN